MTAVRSVRLVIPHVERPLNNLVERSFDYFQAAYCHYPETTIIPEKLGYEGNRDKVSADEKYRSPENEQQDLPALWKKSEFKKEIKALVEAAMGQVQHSDMLVLTGGRDYDPLLLGNPRHKKTQRYSSFDTRDIVETYALLAAIAHGKTIHATCRGYQLVTGNMMQLFAEKPMPICQDIPEFLKEHPEAPESHHHAGRALQGSLNDLLIRHPGWFHKVLSAQQTGKRPMLEGLPDVAHEIAVEKGSLLHDAFSHVKQRSGNTVRTEGEKCYASPATAHHQGWAIAKDDAAGMQELQNALAQAGGKIVALSHDERDGGSQILEAVEFSKAIDAEVLERIKARVTFLNKLLGLDIEMPLPDLEKNPHLRVDVPLGSQPHLEFGMEGEALIVPALTLAFLRAKQQAAEQGVDIGGYQQWRETVNLSQLFEVKNALPKNVHERKVYQGLKTVGHSNNSGSFHQL